MCCLGHLADLIEPDGWKDLTWNGHSVLIWSKRPSWMSRGEHNHGMQLNDTYKWTLPEIADWVDAGMPLDVTVHHELPR